MCQIDLKPRSYPNEPIDSSENGLLRLLYSYAANFTRRNITVPASMTSSTSAAMPQVETVRIGGGNSYAPMSTVAVLS